MEGFDVGMDGLDAGMEWLNAGMELLDAGMDGLYAGMELVGARMEAPLAALERGMVVTVRLHGLLDGVEDAPEPVEEHLAAGAVQVIFVTLRLEQRCSAVAGLV